VRLQVIGDMERVPKNVREKIEETIEHTANNDSMTLVIALSYSSKWELTKAVKNIVADAQKGVIQREDINEDLINNYLETAHMPDPDLLIRTGGELRISNYLLWQIAYSELYFCDTYWPDFDEEELRKAIASYQSRQRRFGKTEAQVEEETEN
jgi:undecaprenyl diphosphate synthase